MFPSLTQFWREKLACAYFFTATGLAYGVFTSRLPAFKAQTGANDAQIGMLLFAFGIASFCGLLASHYLLAKTSVKRLTGLASLAMSCLFIVASIAWSYWHLLCVGMLAGAAMGLCDVSMNAEGIIFEKKYLRRSISFFHACFSLGGVCGSLSGSFFAAFALSPFLNFLGVQGGCLLLLPLAYACLNDEKTPDKKAGEAKSAKRLPAIIFILGAMSMGCYVSEGSIGEWGSILLHSVKGAPQAQAALAFGCFSTTMVIGRFLGDWTRGRFSDFAIVFTGSLTGLVCMTVILLVANPWLCLMCYGVMGFGFAPIVPIFFSRAGAISGVSASRASSTVSMMSYSGQLVFPPFIGLLAELTGLNGALWTIVAVIAGICAGSFRLRRD